MKESPRRPLILKRRKLPFPKKSESQVPARVRDGRQNKEAQPLAGGIRIVDHPSMADTQVVIISKTADLQSVISALTAKGKECGPKGPNKFILLSGGTLEDGPESLCLPSLSDRSNPSGNSVTLGARLDEGLIHGGSADCPMEAKPLTITKTLNKELDCSPLDESLTNIQWLGRMSTDVLGPNPVKKSSNKENQDSMPKPPRESEEPLCAAKDTMSERPPYSYMAMIQFAINSKKNRKMTLKEIYTWIEDHFLYFRNVAKLGWKNSIRHNLSLHDMFVRETSPDGKISYWTIRPEANRCLTLDQVYKPMADPAAPSSLQTTQVCEPQQQKRAVPELKKTAVACGSERKMKPLLPRADSYLVPIQLPLTPSLFLPSTHLTVTTSQQSCGSSASGSLCGGKRVRIAPKVPQYIPPPVETFKEESLSVPLTCPMTEAQPLHSRKEAGGSRRKQRLVLPSSEEPVLLFADSTFYDSGLVSDLSAFQDTREADPEPEAEIAFKLEPDSPGPECVFKTPIKGSHPASSTPSKPPVMQPELSRATPLGPEGRGILDFSPIRTPHGAMLTPGRQDHTSITFNSTPFKEIPLFSTPCELLAFSCSSPAARACSRELQVGGTATPNRSLTEGLVLDTMNESLSKILMDISFSGLEDEDLGMANISWSQLIPELK